MSLYCYLDENIARKTLLDEKKRILLEKVSEIFIAHRLMQNFITSKNTSIKITHLVILRFCPAGAM